MKIELKNVPNENLTTIEQILFNRGITDIDKYIHTTIEDIAEPELLGEDLLKRAYGFLRDAIVRNEDVVVIVDADCDGFTSAAVIINYLYISYKEWATYHLHYLLHEGKQHGLSDHLQTLLQSNYSLIIVPDGGTNDVNECNALSMLNKKVIVLDHHEKEVDNNCAIIINSTLNGYPNNQLSGAGVTWQFCRYIDKLLNKEYNLANEFIDLAAIGAQGDMMSLRSLETKALIWEGLRQRNIKNPLISGLIEKNDFSLNKAEYKSSYLKISPMGASFFVVPLINACVRSGTMEEKDLIFKSMLNQYAFEEILSNKRGHKLGEKEERVTQALRTLTNVKNRQTKAQDAGMALLEKKIVEQDMLKHKVLLFTLEPGQIDANVAGLAANKIMGKYQRPVCVLTLRDGAYQGSARGCNAVGVTEFKTMCEYTELTEYTIGHQGAFGLSVKPEYLDAFIAATDDMLVDMSDTPIHRVDFAYEDWRVDESDILDIASMNDFWGQDLERPLIAIMNLKVNNKMVSVYRKDTNTVKISLPTGPDIMIFGAEKDFCNMLEKTQGYVKLNIVGECTRNEWGGSVTGQIKCKEYEILQEVKYIF